MAAKTTLPAPRRPESRLLTAFLWIGMALGARVLLAQPAIAADDHWITDAKGCKVLNPNPQPKDSITWSGVCNAGYAEGPGQLSWMNHGKSEYTFDGTLHAGRKDGPGTVHYANGDRYEGEFYANRLDGRGVFTFANGNRYEGDFVKGMSTRQGTLTDGQQFKTDLLTGRTSWIELDGEVSWIELDAAPTTLFVICYAANDQLESVTVIRSSGVYIVDENGAGFLKGMSS
jgi:hypothetical protein